MKNLLICEFSNIFGYGEVRLPYSTGVLWSYCKSDETISKNYKVSNWIYWKDEKEKIMEHITEKPDVVLLSIISSYDSSNTFGKLLNPNDLNNSKLPAPAFNINGCNIIHFHGSPTNLLQLCEVSLITLK